MLRVLLISLLVLPVALPSHLVLDADAPPPAPAGAITGFNGTVQLAGPGSQGLPGLSGPVSLSLTAPNASGCRLVDEQVVLDPVTGQAPFEVACRPERPGEHNLTVSAQAPPHRPATWDGVLPVTPDTLALTVRAEETITGFRAPVHVHAQPTHLDRAPVNLTLTSELDGSTLWYADGPLPAAATSQRAWHEMAWTARHGPGSYQLTVHAQGPWTADASATTNVTVHAPEETAELELNLTVPPGQPSVVLTGDSVNKDGVSKYPGQEIITELALEHATEVNISVLRPTETEPVELAHETLAVAEDGTLEHRFTWPTLPTGLLTVQATAGESSVARTAQVRDSATEATLSGPTELLGDGRALTLALAVTDPNFGSTPQDPGPVWGLPDLAWRVLKHTTTATGWEVQAGASTGGPEGTTELSLLPWPQGAPWATVSPGAAALDVQLVPPTDVEARSYRLSLYEAQDDGSRGDLLASHSFELLAPPTLWLSGPEEVAPGGWLPVKLAAEGWLDGTVVNLTAEVEDEVVWNATLDAPQAVSIPVPAGLPAGTEVRVAALGDWPGRPTPQGPDAAVHVPVADVPPALTPTVLLDGALVQGPLPLHPASAHNVTVAPGAADPNGDPVTLSVHLAGPDGSDPGWARVTDGLVEVAVPAGATHGRYALEVVAHAGAHQANTTLWLDVAPVSRVQVSGPTTATLDRGAPTQLELEVANAGSTPLTGLLVHAELPEGMAARVLHGDSAAGLDEAVPVALAPGERATLVLELAPDQAPTGTHQARVTVAGVLP